MFIGLFLLGVGVVPMGIIAYAIEGMWSPAFQMFSSVALIFASRFFGEWLIEKALLDQN